MSVLIGKWERSVIIYTEINVYYIMERMLMVNIIN